MKKILVIEDDSFIREEWLRNDLEEAGCSVNTAENWSIGMEKARSEKPDLIMCAYSLPDIDFMGIMRQMNQTDFLRPIRIIVMWKSSDEFKPSHKGYRAQLGVECLIRKPCTLEELMLSVDWALSHERRELYS
jgi:CheY-like chemotaxis protein